MKHAVVVGAGGLGGPIALALAADGLRVTIFDDDVIDVSNLQRQAHFTLAAVGQSKARVLAARICERDGVARAVATRWAPIESHRGVDLICDASDSPASKFAVNQWAVKHRLPCVIAGAIRYQGTVFLGLPGAACYACLFETPPVDGATCEQAGILGASVAYIGGVAALAALAIAAGQAEPGIWSFADTRHPPRWVPLNPRVTCQCMQGRGAVSVHAFGAVTSVQIEAGDTVATALLLAGKTDPNIERIWTERGSAIAPWARIAVDGALRLHATLLDAPLAGDETLTIVTDHGRDGGLC